jgi:hypothetical protein
VAEFPQPGPEIAQYRVACGARHIFTERRHKKGGVGDQLARSACADFQAPP